MTRERATRPCRSRDRAARNVDAPTPRPAPDTRRRTAPVSRRRRPGAAGLRGVIVLAMISGCAAPDRQAQTDGGRSEHVRRSPEADHHWTTLSPGLRIDPRRSRLEFDAAVAIDCHNSATPDVYLELIACSPDSREHESLIVTHVPPSMIHAGLLAIGFIPGAPAVIASNKGETTRTPPTGQPLRVELLTSHDGVTRTEPAGSWIVDALSRTTRPTGGFVFSGSRIAARAGRPVYDADGAGTVIGLATFGRETIAYEQPISPESSIDTPVWIADPARVPPRGTPVRVRVGRP